MSALVNFQHHGMHGEQDQWTVYCQLLWGEMDCGSHFWFFKY